MVCLQHLLMNYSTPINFLQPFDVLKFSKLKYFSIRFIPVTYYSHQHFSFHVTSYTYWHVLYAVISHYRK